MTHCDGMKKTENKSAIQNMGGIEEKLRKNFQKVNLGRYQL